MNTETKHTPGRRLKMMVKIMSRNEDIQKEIAQLKADKAELVAALQACVSLISDDGKQGGTTWTLKQARNLIAKHSKA